MEHLYHFGLTQDPFSNEPDLRFYFESTAHRDAQRRVERGLRQHKGLTLLTGDGGTGKTLLARRILDSLEDEVFEATLLVMLPGAADATSILQRFARQLGAEEPATDRAALLGQIYEQLAIVREDGRHAVLMIDDAQIMTASVFSELGGLLNLEYEDRRLVSMLLVGSPELDQLVQNDPGIAPRVDVRVRLQALDPDSTVEYVTHRLNAVGGEAGLVPAAALEALYKFGRGRARLLNTLADNALFEAYLAGRTAIDSSDVERAAGDLGIGPDPGSTFTAVSPAPIVATDAPAAAADGPALDLADVVSEISSEPEALDLDADLGSELDDFQGPGATGQLAGVAPAGTAEDFGSFSIESDADALQFDPPISASAPAEELDAAEPAVPAGGATEVLEFALAEAELTTEDGEELEGVFVELIEE